MMKNYDILLFDLDGTLTDPKLGIINSIQYSLKHFGIIETDENRLTEFIGPPLIESFRKHYYFDEDKARLAVAKYREYFAEKGIFENQVYLSIPELLEELSDSGKKLVLATLKPMVFARKVLDYFRLTRYFQFAAGSNLDGTRTEKSEVISYALKECEFNPGSNVVMIGDRKYDIIGARETGIDSIGVLYGYGTRKEMKDEDPTHMADTVASLRTILLAGQCN
ncbi:MAG: HAD family hydrolase [Desulfitobacteriaceae bacterium]|nr:HAD family hydrolase [Desulfitobacteriaceae bacterium]MDD4346875.1 HAD family hydrolase [Desulfitobacteriaceae bacterium]MDD4402124.1 HAD family hydrolase [Desulfitobacteriaceae bacterium]